MIFYFFILQKKVIKIVKIKNTKFGEMQEVYNNKNFGNIFHNFLFIDDLALY